MKARIAASALLALTLGGTDSAIAAGIPVIDVSNLSQQILQVKHMLEQIKQLKRQVENSTKELDRMSGSRGLAGIIDSAYDTSVDVETAPVLNSAGIKSAAENGLSGETAEVYDAQNKTAATWEAQSDKSLQQAKDRYTQLTSLITKVNSTPDQKDVLDLQARIGGEQVMLQNELAKLTMLRSKAQAQQAMHEQKIRQMAIDSAGTPHNVSW